ANAGQSHRRKQADEASAADQEVCPTQGVCPTIDADCSLTESQATLGCQPASADFDCETGEFVSWRQAVSLPLRERARDQWRYEASSVSPGWGAAAETKLIAVPLRV